MNDMISLILTEIGAGTEAGLRHEISAHIAAVRASGGHGNRQQVRQAEDAVRLNPSGAFTFDSDACATLTVNDHSWHAGHFETVSIADLKERAQSVRSKEFKAQTRLLVFDGASPATDIGTLQATSSTDTLFQVASQFNCLESPGEYVTDVVNYFSDSTQGPRASISAFPATLLRHYRAPGPDGKSFAHQTGGQQIDLLAGACDGNVSRNGYFTGSGIADPQVTVAALETNFDKICVGVHADAQVVLGFNWDGAVEGSEHRRIAQVFTSTVAGGGYGGERNLSADNFLRAARQLLRAAYLGTLLAAVTLGRKRVVLTLIGGGVFQNPINLIWDSIDWALAEVQPFLSQDLDVIVNGYNLGTLVNLEKTIAPAVIERGGAVLTFGTTGLVSIRR